MVRDRLKIEQSRDQRPLERTQAGDELRAAPKDIRPPSHRLIRLSNVTDLTGLGKTTIYQLQKEGVFPHSIAVTKYAVRWVESEVLAWIDRQKDQRTPRSPPQASAASLEDAA